MCRFLFCIVLLETFWWFHFCTQILNLAIFLFFGCFCECLLMLKDQQNILLHFQWLNHQEFSAYYSWMIESCLITWVKLIFCHQNGISLLWEVTYILTNVLFNATVFHILRCQKHVPFLWLTSMLQLQISPWGTILEYLEWKLLLEGGGERRGLGACPASLAA